MGLISFAQRAIALLFAMLILFWIPNSQAEGQADNQQQAAVALTYGNVGATVTRSSVITKPGRSDIERGFLGISLPSVLDSSFIDKALLVFTGSTVFDSTEPLIIGVFPATGPASAEWSEAWDRMSGGFNPAHMAISSVDTTLEQLEVAIDVTPLVRLWQSGDLPNYGLVIKTLSEDKSTFHWIKDRRYQGDNAKLDLWYSRR